jgi:hypothetical protein
MARRRLPTTSDPFDKRISSGATESSDNATSLHTAGAAALRSESSINDCIETTTDASLPNEHTNTWACHEHATSEFRATLSCDIPRAIYMCQLLLRIIV